MVNDGGINRFCKHSNQFFPCIGKVQNAVKNKQNTHTHNELMMGRCDLLITSPPEGVARYCFSPGMSVCQSVCVCVCVCPANILVFYFSAIRRDIDLKFIQDTYQVGNGTGITDRSEKTIRSVKAGRFCSWRSEISGHFLHFTWTWPPMSFSCWYD